MKPKVPAVLQQLLKSSGVEDAQNIQLPKNGLGSRIFQQQNRRHSSAGLTKKSGSAASLASLVSIESASESYCRKNPIPESKKRERKPIHTPQGFLEAALEERGYSTEKYISMETGYYCLPTPLQKASYGTRMNEAVLNSDATLLRRLLDVGLSPNPCNDFGESLVHRICRRGDVKLLRVLLEKGCCLQIADDYGRTPLHDAFWKAEPSEEILKLILKADRDLIRMMDCRGFVPLDYVRKEAHPEMIQFLKERILDNFFPPRDHDVDDQKLPAPILAQRKPHSTPVPDPRIALNPQTAALVASGAIEPEDALHWDDSSDDSPDDWDTDDNSNISDNSETAVEDLDIEFDEAEILELCRRVGGPMAISKHCNTKKSPIVTTTRRSFVRDGPLHLSSSNLSIHPEDFLEEA